jgi:hypothetical protein
MAAWNILKLQRSDFFFNWRRYNCGAFLHFALGGSLQICYKVLPFLLLLEAGKDHPRARDVLLGVLQVGEQCLPLPGNAFVLVGGRVIKVNSLASLAAPQAHQVGALLVLARVVYDVALGALLFEDSGALLWVSGFDLVRHDDWWQVGYGLL